MSSDISSNRRVATGRSAISNRFVLPIGTQKSLNLDGINDFVTVPIVPSLTGFCFGLWVKAKDFSSTPQLVSYNNNGNGGFKLYFPTTRRFYSIINNVVTAVVNAGGKTGSIVIEKWYFVVFSYVPNNFNLFVDANEAAIITDTSCMMTEPSDQVITIGKNSYALNGWFKGLVKNLTFQNTTIPWTQQQIEDLYYQNKIPDGAKQWSMNNVATDQNGENALTITGAAYTTDVPLQERTSA